MKTITTILGAKFILFGFFILMLCYESVTMSLSETLCIGFVGLGFMAVGVLCLMWYMPIGDQDEQEQV